MRNVLRFCVSVGLLFLMSPHAVRAQHTNLPLWEACQIDEPQDLSWEYRWRWRAEQNLSCLVQKLNQSITTASDTKGPVTLSRQQLQQLLNLAWGARDAAQRIGR